MNWNARDAGNRAGPDRPAADESCGTSGGTNETTGGAVTIARPGARLFIGIKVDPDIATELATMARALENSPVRLIRAADIHLTLVPPWNETDIAGAVENLRKVLLPVAGFDLVFRDLHYGPTLAWPRFLWAECAATTELLDVQKMLMAAFGQTEARPFRPHVTLARIPRKGRMIARRNPIDRKLHHIQHVGTIDMFRSPEPGDEGYRVIASLPLPGTSDGAEHACCD